MTGTRIKDKDDLRIKEILNDEYYLHCVMKYRGEIRGDARKNIIRLQEESKWLLNRKRKIKLNVCKINDLVAIQRTQFGSGLKLLPKFYGPYQVTPEKTKDLYDVEKVGNYEGPIRMSTATDHMKPWMEDVNVF